MDSVATSRSSLFRYPWMFGKEFDLFFFFISYFLGLIFLQITSPFLDSQNVILLALIPTAFGLGPFHQGPTWFAYLDSQNQAHWKTDFTRRAIFFLGPPVLFVLSIIGVFQFRALLGMAWIVWSIQHLVQQNVGILLLYHNYKNNEVVVARGLEEKSQQIAAVFFTLVFLRRCLLNQAGYVVVDSFIWISAIIAGCLVMIYLRHTYNQMKRGKVLNVPGFVFWIFSIICLWPMAFIGKDFTVGFVAPLIWHWFQYIGLNWRLIKNKYIGERLHNLPIARPFFLFISTCCVFVVINLILGVLSKQPSADEGLFQKIAMALLFGLGFTHYFLDAFLWRFRESYQRQTILPYLKTAI